MSEKSKKQEAPKPKSLMGGAGGNNMLQRLLTNVQRIKEGDSTLPSKQQAAQNSAKNGGLAARTVNAYIYKMGIKVKRHDDEDNSDSDQSVKYAAPTDEKMKEGMVVSQSSDSDQI